MTGQGPGQEHSGTLLRLATVLKRNDSTPGVPCCSTLQTGRPLVGYYNRDNRRSTRNISCLWSSDQKQSQQQLGRGQRSWTTKESTGKSKITLSDYYSQGREWTSSKLVWFISCRHILRTAGLRLGKRTTCSEWTRGGGWNVNLFTPTKVSAKMRPHKTSPQVSLVNSVLTKRMRSRSHQHLKRTNVPISIWLIFMPSLLERKGATKNIWSTNSWDSEHLVTVQIRTQKEKKTCHCEHLMLCKGSLAGMNSSIHWTD